MSDYDYYERRKVVLHVPTEIEYYVNIGLFASGKAPAHDDIDKALKEHLAQDHSEGGKIKHSIAESLTLAKDACLKLDDHYPIDTEVKAKLVAAIEQLESALVHCR